VLEGEKEENEEGEGSSVKRGCEGSGGEAEAEPEAVPGTVAETEAGAMNSEESSEGGGGVGDLCREDTAAEGSFFPPFAIKRLEEEAVFFSNCFFSIG
jgi:hypothetical protein